MTGDLDEIRDLILAFEGQTEKADYTDTGDAWDLLLHIKRICEGRQEDYELENMTLETALSYFCEEAANKKDPYLSKAVQLILDATKSQEYDDDMLTGAAQSKTEEREVPDLNLDCGCVQQRCNRCEF